MTDTPGTKTRACYAAALLALLPLTALPPAGHAACNIPDAYTQAIHSFVKAADTGGNLLLSTHGICESLSMLSAGAEGQTRTELAAFLAGFCRERSASFSNKDSGWKFANAIIHREGLRFSSSYLRSILEFNPIVFNASDAGDAKRLSALLIEYVGEDIGDELGLDGAELALLTVNAFVGRWLTGFEPDQTRPGVFHGSSGDAEVPMMGLASFFQFGRTNGARYIALPYSQVRFGAIAAYWDDDRDALDLLQLTDIYCAFEQPFPRVGLSLPKFSLEKRGMSLTRPLLRRGVERIFNPATAQLGGLTGNGAAGLRVADVVQHVTLKVHEAGSEARSATAVTMIRGALPKEPDEVFVADKPFVFLILDRAQANVLFVAVVRDLQFVKTALSTAIKTARGSLQKAA